MQNLYFSKKQINFGDYDETFENVKFNLPREVSFCKKCLISNQRPNMMVEAKKTLTDHGTTIEFKDGVCVACQLAEAKENEIDWDEREHELVTLLDRYRSRNGSYDIIVPGSGGKDSFYVAHQLKYKYGMHPITCTFSPNIYSDWGRINLDNWINAGFQNYLFTCDQRVHRLITRIAVEHLLHPFQPWILGQKHFPVKFCKMTDVPLIFYGENPAEYGNPNDKYYEDMMLEWHTAPDPDDIYISGIHVNELKMTFNLDECDVEPYKPMSVAQYEKLNIKNCAWSYFKKWHPQENYYYTVENSDFQVSTERSLGTYTKSSSLDDKLDDLHYYTAFVKFGMGRATYDATTEIRNKDLDIEEGRSLIKKYDGEYPDRFLDELLAYLSLDPGIYPGIEKIFEEPTIDREYFDNLCDSFRSPHIWKYANHKWELRHTPYE